MLRIFQVIRILFLIYISFIEFKQINLSNSAQIMYNHQSPISLTKNTDASQYNPIIYSHPQNKINSQLISPKSLKAKTM